MLPLIGRSNSFFYIEESLKYFLVQSVASSQLLFRYLFKQILRFYWVNLWLVVILRIKLGAAPFHNWFIRVLKRIRYLVVFIFSTIQKLLPMYLLQFVFSNTIKFFIFFSAIVAALGSFNQLLVRKLLAYSSIILVAWILRGVFLRCFINWGRYWLIYTLRLVILLGLLKNNYIRFQFVSQTSLHYLVKFYILVALLRLRGVPPFRLFFIKIIYIRNLIILMRVGLRRVLLMFSLWIIYFYIRLGLNSFLRINRQKCLRLVWGIKSSFTVVAISGSYLVLINYLYVSVIM